MRAQLNQLKKFYNLAKIAKVGDVVECTSCCAMFTKETYQQKFCKSQPGTICKDFYWNNVTPTKRNNTIRISLANARYYENHILPLIERAEYFDDDQSWDAHKDSF